MPKPFSYGEMNGKEQGRMMAGKAAAASTAKVIQEGIRTGMVGRCEDELKGLVLLCRTPQERSLMGLIHTKQ